MGHGSMILDVPSVSPCFLLLMQVSWGCAFSFEKKFTLKEKASFLVQVSLYLKECSQNIQNPNKLSGTKRIQNNIYITTHQCIHRSHTLSSMLLPGINDSNEQSLNCNFIYKQPKEWELIPEYWLNVCVSVSVRLQITLGVLFIVM